MQINILRVERKGSETPAYNDSVWKLNQASAFLEDGARAVLNLINDLINSDKKFLYEASDIFLGRNGLNGGLKTGIFIYSRRGSGIINASDGGLDSQLAHHM